MGNDVSGILFYGILVDEDVPRPWRESHSGFWEEYYQEKTGKPASESGCTLGSYDELGTVDQEYVALAALEFEGYCRPPREISPDLMMNIPFGAERILREFCEVLGIPYREPKWYLVGCYG